MAAKSLEQQIADLKVEIANRTKEAAQLDVDSQRLVLSDSEGAIKAASRAVAIRGLLPLQKKGLFLLVSKLVLNQIAEAEAAIDREMERRLAEKAKNFPSLQDRIYALGRAYNDLAKHPDAPRLLAKHSLLSPDAFRAMVEGAPALLDAWRAADRKALEEQAKEEKVASTKAIATAGQDLQDDDEQPPAAEVKAS